MRSWSWPGQASRDFHGERTTCGICRSPAGEEIGRHGIEMAEQLKTILHEKKLPFYLESPTNQQFVILANDRLAELKKQVDCGFWEKYDDTHTVVRFATSWSTTAEDLAALRRLL